MTAQTASWRASDSGRNVTRQVLRTARYKSDAESRTHQRDERIKLPRFLRDTRCESVLTARGHSEITEATWNSRRREHPRVVGEVRDRDRFARRQPMRRGERD